MKANLKEKSQVLEGLNEQQEKAVTFGDGPLLIIAGAGTGKTTVLTRRIVWLIEQGLAKPDEILALTFTEKAANEMEERVDLLMPLGYSEITISTFHAFAQKILLQHALDIGLPGDFKILTDVKAWMLVKQHIYDFDLDYYLPKGNPNKFIYALLKHFDRAKREEISPEEYLAYAQSLQMNLDNVEITKKARKKKIIKDDLQADPAEVSRIAEVANAYHKYQKLLLDNSYLDFGDLISYTLKLFRARQKVLKSYQDKYKYILLDEFQDTDLAQYELIKLLALPQNNITMVGDDDQSIYKFRGASVSNILKFQEDFPGAAEVTLTDNYRSSQQILDLSYKFIQQNNPERLEAKLKISKKLTSHKPETASISVIHALTGHDEAKTVADKIAELNESQGVGFNEFAILVRANDHAEPFLLELSRRGIPYIFVASRGLYKKSLILDLLAYLRLLDNYHKNDLMFRVLTLPKFKLDHNALIDISHTAHKKALSVYEVLQELKLNPKISELLRLMDKHCRQISETPVTQLLYEVIVDLGIRDNLMNDTIENVENRGLLQQFYRKVQDFESESDQKNLKAFLLDLDLEIEAGDQGTLSASPEMGPEAVKVMTIHSAKGLEFGCVFIVNMVDQRFPSRDRKEQIELPDSLVKEILPEGDAHLMEERRLLYVGATRAKQYLFLTWADDYGGTAQKKPSSFLVELGLEKPFERSKPSGEVFFIKQPALPILKPEYQVQVPETFDFSQISTFKKCPLEYKYKYIYKLPLPGAAALSFGQTMHNTLKKFLTHVVQLNTFSQQDLFGQKQTGIQIPKKETLVRFYSESWVDDWYPDKINKQAYRADGLKYLDKFYEKFCNDPKLPKYLEQSFRLKLGEYKFKGRIDRADANSDGSIDIIDYKTGEPRVKLEQVDRDQLLIYQWAAEEGFKEKINSLSYWYFKALDDPLKFLGTKEDIEKLKVKLLESIEEIVETIKTDGFMEKDMEKSHECKFRHLESNIVA
ncbi:MAG: ATP-dependent DNA helicase [Candidatus Doudnabacteria bacterium]